jgi:hypothetical protein
LDPDAVQTLLQVPGVIDDQHGARVAQLVDHVTAHVIAYLVGVPHRLTQQTLHSMG